MSSARLFVRLILLKEGTMKRDMDLIRGIVLKLEGLEMSPGRIAMITDVDKQLPIEGFTADEIRYHLKLIVDEGWIDTAGAKSMSGIGFRALTWAGHDFADSVRDEKIWAMTKDGALKAGGFTLGLLSDLAKGFIKKKLSDSTGIDL